MIPEVTNQAAFLAIGLDTTVMLASSAGQLELNVMEPVITFALYMQMKVMTNACNHLREKCIDGIVVNAEHCKDLVMGSLGIITILKPHFGYKPCANIAREGFLTGKSPPPARCRRKADAYPGTVGQGLHVRKPHQPEVRKVRE